MEIMWSLMLISLATLVFTISIITGDSFYFSGDAAVDFKKNDPLQVTVKRLSSPRTQVPYSYYSLPYCRTNISVSGAENLGEVLRGDRIENSPYVFRMREAEVCRILCNITLNDKEANELKEKIEDGYQINMVLDNLPLVRPIRMREGYETIYQQGFQVGTKGQYVGNLDYKYFIHNHLSFLVKYHKYGQSDLARIVGFEVKPFSLKNEYGDEWNRTETCLSCNPHAQHIVLNCDGPQEVEAKKEIIFTYDVEFEESDIKWASRWDIYLPMPDDQIHWCSVINSLMTVLFLSGLLAMVMRRTLYKDISRYNQLETQEEAQDDTGWKVVHGDVFRPPPNSDLLCVYVGTGVQLFGMTLVTMIIGVLGFFSPSKRGTVVLAMVLLWVIMGLFAGYSSAHLHRKLKGTDWKKIALWTSFTFPGFAFTVLLILNACIWWETSSTAVSFITMFVLAFLWLGISVPLVFIGGFLGFKKPIVEDPVKTNKIIRQIPKQPWYLNQIFSILIAGILPFGAVMVELFFILTSIWMNQVYHLFGFVFIGFLIFIVICMEITVLLCYLQLCKEDYLWWWRSYLTSASPALYLFLYAGYYFINLEITKPVSVTLYFGYMLIASVGFFFCTGTIGFLACFWFTRLIYSSVKVA